MAEEFSAPMPQLRAAVRLCRIATEPERSDRLETLRAVRATLTEGLGAPDVVEADALLN
jgi:hypothetical protein